MFRQEFACATGLFVGPRFVSGEPAIDNSDNLKAAMADLSERIYLAFQTLRRLPDRERSYLAADRRGSWPQVIVTYWEAYGKHTTRVRLPPPSAAAISDMETVMGWLSWLGRIDRGAMNCVFACCGRGLEPSQVAGAILPWHRNTVRRKRDEGLSMLVEKFGAQDVRRI